MTENNGEDLIQVLSLVLDEYSEWFGRVMRKSFYPEESTDISDDPPHICESLSEELDGKGVHEKVAETVQTIIGELHDAAGRLVASGREGDGKPALELLDELINLHDEFTASIRRIEKDELLEGSGIDALTGLRTEEAMFRDLKQEMERTSRRGKPFCVVLARLDGFDELSRSSSESDMQAILGTAADVIRKCIRTYDDAYYPSEGEFVLSLKHADINGGLAAVDRLRRLLVESGEDITMSYVTAEPGDGDEISGLLDYLREDINRYVSDRDVSIQYYEVSPLKRYLQNVEPEDKS